ncbi:MAG: hypothetical protein ACSLEM_04725 [Candidatus Malihini olakiniferum]
MALTKMVVNDNAIAQGERRKGRKAIYRADTPSPVANRFGSLPRDRQ